jgi:hypothetical protein
MIQLYKHFYFSDLSFFEFEKKKLSIVKACYVYSEIAFLAYPNSVRISKIISLYTSDFNSDYSGCDFLKKFLAISVSGLESNIEYETDGNHLIANYEALIHYYVFMTVDRGPVFHYFKCLLKALNEQILKDGFHYEKSHMYHRVVLNHLLKIRKSLNYIKFDVGVLDFQISKMMYLERFISNDKILIGFGDSVTGLYSFEEYFLNKRDFENNIYQQYSSQVDDCLNVSLLSNNGLQILHMKSSGIVLFKADKYFGALNFGEIKAKNVPGHSHSDELALELYREEYRLIGSVGVSTYENCPERLVQRGCVSKSTVFDCHASNHSEVWSSFRVARKSTVELQDIIFDGANFKIKAKLVPAIRKRNFFRKVTIGRDFIRVSDEADCDFTSQYIIDESVKYETISSFEKSHATIFNTFECSGVNKEQLKLFGSKQLATEIRIVL